MLTLSVADGPVGLAFKYGNSIRPDQQGTFMEFLEPLVDQPVFSSYFTHDDTGHVEFGSSDDSQKTGDYTVVPVSHNLRCSLFPDSSILFLSFSRQVYNWT